MFKLTIYSLGHALVDLISAILVLSVVDKITTDPGNVILIILLYNSLAFGTQFLIGFIADRFLPYKFYALAGYTLTALAIIVFHFIPILSIILIGIGNASYHIGGGLISLNLQPGKAGPPGIFVAPGALGLLIGTLLSKNNLFPATPLLVVLAGFIILTLLLPKDLKPIRKKLTELNHLTDQIIKPQIIFILIYLLLFVIAGRSLIGSLINYSWKSDINLLIIIVTSITLGKAFGGIIADKFGMLKVGVISLLLAFSLISLGYYSPIAGIFGLFFFNFTMPITLVSLAKILKGNNGLAFGLTCLALLLGSLLTMSPLKQYADSLIIPAIIMIPTSAFVLFAALKIMHKLKI